jgi:hypothetical protein
LLQGGRDLDRQGAAIGNHSRLTHSYGR